MVRREPSLIVRFAIGARTGGVLIFRRMTVTTALAVSGGWPLSVTLMPIAFVVPPSARLVCHVIRPLSASTITPGGALGPRLKKRESWLGSLAVTSSESVWPASSVTLGVMEITGG